MAALPVLETEQDPVDWLRRLFLERKRRNPRYTQRAFARALGINSGRLSEIFSRKRRLTTDMGERIAGALGLGPEESQRLVLKILATRDGQPAPSSREVISDDVFRYIADGIHLALLNLLQTVDAPSQPAGFARRLGVTVPEAVDAAERLQRLGMVERREDGRFIRVAAPFTTTQDIPSAALRHAHEQMLQKAQSSLAEVPVELREITSAILAIDPKRLTEAKAAIRRFRRDLGHLLESGDLSEVYALNIQLVPLTQRKEQSPWLN